MEDKRDFIEQCQSLAKLASGSELTPMEMAREFAKRSHTERVIDLDQLNQEDRNGEPSSIHQAARRLPYTRALKAAHELLRRNGR